jgi:hypothetical protein
LLRDGEEAALVTTQNTLRQLERCWSDAVRYAGAVDSDL